MDPRNKEQRSEFLSVPGTSLALTAAPTSKSDSSALHEAKTFVDKVLRQSKKEGQLQRFRHVIAIGLTEIHHPQTARELVPPAIKDFKHMTPEEKTAFDAYKKRRPSEAASEQVFSLYVEMLKDNAASFVAADFVKYFGDGKVVNKVGRITTYAIEKEGRTLYVHHLPAFNKQVVMPELDKQELDYLAAVWKDSKDHGQEMLVHCKGGTGRTSNLVAGLLGLEARAKKPQESYQDAYNKYYKARGDAKWGRGVEDDTGQDNNAKAIFEYFASPQYKLNAQKIISDEEFVKQYADVVKELDAAIKNVQRRANLPTLMSTGFGELLGKAYRDYLGKQKSVLIIELSDGDMKYQVYLPFVKAYEDLSQLALMLGKVKDLNGLKEVNQKRDAILGSLKNPAEDIARQVPRPDQPKATGANSDQETALREIANKQETALREIANKLLSMDRSESKGIVGMKEILEARTSGEVAKMVLERLQKKAEERLKKAHIGTGDGLFGFMQQKRNDENQSFYEALRDLNIGDPNIDELRDKLFPKSEDKEVKESKSPKSPT